MVVGTQSDRSSLSEPGDRINARSCLRNGCIHNSPARFASIPDFHQLSAERQTTRRHQYDVLRRPRGSCEAGAFVAAFLAPGLSSASQTAWIVMDFAPNQTESWVWSD